jgi:ricin-type beta-trefoil lectin protein
MSSRLSRLRLVARSAAVAVVMGAALLGAAGAAVAAPPPGTDTEPGASAVVPPRDPNTWFIKNSGLTATTRPYDSLPLWNINPTTTNPIYVSVLWHFTPVPHRPGAYYVENHNGGCLDIADGISKAIGVKITTRQCDYTQSQQWFTPYKNGKYALKNQWSGLYGTFKNPIGENTVMTQQTGASFQEMYHDMPLYQS